MAQPMPQPISRQQKKETPAEAVFKAILAEDIEWKPFAAFPLNAVATRGEDERGAGQPNGQGALLHSVSRLSSCIILHYGAAEIFTPQL